MIFLFQPSPLLPRFKTPSAGSAPTFPSSSFSCSEFHPIFFRSSRRLSASVFFGKDAGRSPDGVWPDRRFCSSRSPRLRRWSGGEPLRTPLQTLKEGSSEESSPVFSWIILPRSEATSFFFLYR